MKSHNMKDTLHKKRKWYIGGIIPVIYSAIRYGLTFLFVSLAWNNLHVETLKSFELFSFLIGLLVSIAGYATVFGLFSRIKDDFRRFPDKFSYNFFVFPALLLIKNIFNILTAVKWEMDTLELIHRIDELNGIPVAGHASGMITFGAFAYGILEILFGIIVAVIFTVIFNRIKKKKINS